MRTYYKVYTDGSVKRYGVSGGGLNQITQNGNYSANQLTYTETKDENDNTVQEFRDSHERLVLRRVKNDGGDLDTYYVYDEIGQLRAVLQPQYQQESDLNKYAFLYKYNNRGLLVEKKVPGAGVATMAYNSRDLLETMTDGRGQPFYYLYDEANRQREMGVNGNPLVYNYYDDYGFSPFRGYDNELQLSGNEFVNNPQGESRKGLVTGQRSRILNDDGTYGDWLWTVTYYDNRERPIQVVRQLYGMGGDAYERISYKYSFDGRVLQERTTQGTSSKTYQLDKLMEYDQAGRLVKTDHTFRDNGSVQKQYTHLAQSYNEVGQLAQKRLFNSLRGQSYKYQVRGWLCEAGNTNGQGLTLSLNYYGNGNIQNLNWGTPHRSGGMSLSYDRASRLTNAWGSGSFQDYNETGLGYDRNGNLTNLTRMRAGSYIDQLSYHYNGNQLHRVDDSGNGGEGFVNGSNQQDEMAYDGNGNLTRDYNRGYNDNSMQYNALNLVRYINKSNQELRYTYDAAGVKQKMQSPEGITFYAGAFEYNANGTLLRVGLEEGQLVRNPDGSYTLHHYLKDHLGNVRLVFDEQGQTVQETEYYAFGYEVSRSGEEKNKYLYNGKEKQPQTGFLDYGARQYDATLGRWMSVDPLAAIDYSYSPYTYVGNNSLRFIDPDGMKRVNVEGTNNYYDDETGELTVVGKRERSDPLVGHLFVAYARNYEKYGHSSPFQEAFHSGGRDAALIIGAPLLAFGAAEVGLGAAISYGSSFVNFAKVANTIRKVRWTPYLGKAALSLLGQGAGNMFENKSQLDMVGLFADVTFSPGSSALAGAIGSAGYDFRNGNTFSEVNDVKAGMIKLTTGLGFGFLGDNANKLMTTNGFSAAMSGYMNAMLEVFNQGVDATATKSMDTKSPQR
ncbi:RHS repeat domain-containing protein [Telluribacter humicola]|uniref:RHS repeat domain-containing protein n=1 Tax=Telluribacter humicola TaxID=1720261 RepID=UPI001A978573|nr:RHS repeat-associated core domain-containing protein [Telluribacter humicola]